MYLYEPVDPNIISTEPNRTEYFMRCSPNTETWTNILYRIRIFEFDGVYILQIKLNLLLLICCYTVLIPSSELHLNPD